MQTTRRTFLGMTAMAAGALALPRTLLAAGQRPSLNIAVQDLRTILEPVDASSIANVSWRVQYSIYDQLLRTDYNDNFRLNYALAKSLRQIDAQTHEIVLRDNVKFHDGSTMTADDVVFSLSPERLRGEKAPGAAVFANFLSSIADVQKVDDQTIRLVTATEDPVFANRLGAWGSQIVSAKAWNAAKNYDAWAAKPIGTGPYKIGDVRTGDEITLVAHDDYWGGQPPFASIRFKRLPEIAARIAGLKAGDYDIVTDVTPDHISEIDGVSGLAVTGGEAMWFRFLTFAPLKTPVLKDVNLRRALAFAIDRDALADGLWNGRAKALNGWQLPIFGAINDPERKGVSFDPAMVKELLAKSSYKGEEIPYPTVGTYYPMQLADNQALVEMWKAAGINVKLMMCENWDQVGNIGGINDTSGGAFYADPVSMLWQIIGPTNDLQSTGAWTNDEFNKLGHELETTTDLAKRKAAFKRMQDIVEIDDPCITPLHSMPFIYGQKKDVVWQPNPLPQMYLGPKMPSEPVA
ncbi:ABC transporter substrate-binding protein [Mesorhizobium sp. SARCC-RB16n]|uniref:ABC transporter substrate-binding protein n=1 Tax=Mesorhizobium sp. SARCC-RB16n TaxID=2116687 RepID=UPI00122ECC9F|nr:ABC transporter substrate-binding protein [Mesorhizobium sp. SARCC-RB16n]KAA3442083.1 ABC transporter substrate-binding protein [Mesorhizobium sp. SARCC-RB16n]